MRVRGSWRTRWWRAGVVWWAVFNVLVTIAAISLGISGDWANFSEFGIGAILSWIGSDRWADLAVATWSVEWNYGPQWEGLLLEAYGIAPDPDRSSYYRLLWDLGP